MHDPNGSLAQQYEKLRASLPPSMRIIQRWASDGGKSATGDPIASSDAPPFNPQYHCTVIKEEDSDGISISSESIRLSSGNIVKSLVWDSEAGKMWTDPEEYQRHMANLINDRSRQAQSAKKYLFKEDLFDLIMPSGLSLGEASELLESCENELLSVDKVVLSVEDEGLFRAREEGVEPYFASQLGWTSGKESGQETGNPLRQRFGVDQDTLMQMDPSDRSVITDIVAVVTTAQQRRLAIERNRRRLHVLIEDGIKSVELYSAYINAIRAYDLFLIARTVPHWRSVGAERAWTAMNMGGGADDDAGSSDDDASGGVVTNDLLARVDQVFNADSRLGTGRSGVERPTRTGGATSGTLHTCSLTTPESLAALSNYRRVILRTCLNSLRAKRHEIFGLTTILNESRIWSEDLLERAVKLEKQVQNTVDELVQGPFPLLPVSPPVISDWLNETEQAAHTCATVSYILTTKAKLHPKSLNHQHAVETKNSWVLGIPLFESFVVEDSGSATDSDQN